MRPEQLDPGFLAAQAIKISILRLLNAYETPCDCHADDWQFDVYGLVLVLGRQQTDHAKTALIDLLDFVIPDAVWDAIVTVVEEDAARYLPALRARLGQPMCQEALRPKPYVDVMPQKNRDQQIKNWLSERDS